MKWIPELIQYYIEHYYELRDYELNPFEEIRIFFGELCLTGSKPNLAPYEETCDLNWEFDKSLKKLGNREGEFRKLYLDGEGENKELFNEFRNILMENNDE